MRLRLLLLLLGLAVIGTGSMATAGAKLPRVRVLATGGTIAGAQASATGYGYKSGRGVLEIIRERKLLTEKQIQELLDPDTLTGLDPKRYQQRGR